MEFLSNELFDVKFQYCSVLHHWLKLEELVYFAGLSNRFDPLPCKKLLFCTCSLYKDLLRTNMQNNDLLITKIYRITYMQSYPTKFHFKCCPSENKKNIVKLTSSQTTANSFVSFPSDSGYERHYGID